MIQTMKKLRFLPLAVLLGFVLVSCNKDSNKEWKQFYGYTVEDIVGTYVYSNVQDAFDGLMESEYSHICEDAQVTITPYLNSQTSIEFKVNCPGAGFNKSFTGRPFITEDSFLVKMSLPSGTLYPDYELTAHVYQNDKGDIRLNGFARRIFYEVIVVDGETHKQVKSVVNYYFDVIKK